MFHHDLPVALLIASQVDHNQMILSYIWSGDLDSWNSITRDKNKQYTLL